MWTVINIFIFLTLEFFLMIILGGILSNSINLLLDWDDVFNPIRLQKRRNIKPIFAWLITIPINILVFGLAIPYWIHLIVEKKRNK